MIPCLYHANETQYSTNGIGKLSDAISCTVTEKRNGSFELKLTYPSDGIHAGHLEEGNIILARPAEKKRSQPFRIYKITTPLSGMLSVQARRISYQLNFITVSPVSASGCATALSALKQSASQDCPFTLETDISSSASFSVGTPASLRNSLGGMEGSILDTFGGEYEWDRYSVYLHKSRGADHGVRIVYGKNLIDFSMERSIENVITALHPYWKDSETGEVVELPEKVVKVTRATVPYEKVSVLDCTGDFENRPTEEQLRNRAGSYLKSTSLTDPNVDISINFTQLWQTPGYEDVVEAERVSLCDTVHVYICKLGIEVSSKVTETEYDVLLERYRSIVLPNSTVSSRNSSLTASLNGIREAASTAGRVAARAEVEASDAILMNASQQLLNILSVSLLGLHCSSGTDDSGETVQYAYNAVNLSASTFAWKNSKAGLFISSDGGRTWKYGWSEEEVALMTAFDTPEVMVRLDQRYVQDNEDFWNGLDEKYVQSEGLTDTLDKRYVQSEDLTDTLDERYLQIENLPAPQITITDTAPEEPAENALWVDAAMTPKRLKLWNGKEWEIVGYEPADTEPTEPTDPDNTEGSADNTDTPTETPNDSDNTDNTETTLEGEEGGQ